MDALGTEATMEVGRSRAVGGIALILALASEAAGAGMIGQATISPAFFNPSIGQQVRISVKVEAAGELQVEIIDRDGFQVRRLETRSVEPGVVESTWDGKDDAGRIVPDEAFTPRLTLTASGRVDVEDPFARHVPEVLENIAPTYSRVSGVLAFELPRASRVHIQAGQASGQDSDGRTRGPVLRTVVDREPRVGGKVVQVWNGFDESGKVYVADLPRFAVGILATTLPDSSILTVGNRGLSFVDYARATRPPSATSPRAVLADAHAHHQGLNAFEDRGPKLSLSWVEEGALNERLPSTSRSLHAELETSLADHFLAQPTTLYVFVDEREIARIESPINPVRVQVPADLLSGTGHRVVVNWGSSMGPVSVGVITLEPETGTEVAISTGGFQ